MSVPAADSLALHGGTPLRQTPWPGRGHFGAEEKTAVDALFDEAIAANAAPGYNGPHEQAYCEAFATFMGGGFADAVNAGTTAVYVALRALDLEPFTEVVVSPITDPGGMMPIVMLNCIPIVADAAPGCYNTSPEEIAKVITPRTSAIVVAHIGGEPVDMPAIMALARKHNLKVVEDVAQAHGARLNGQLLGTFGDIAAFSTMNGKHHCTGGQGGVVFTRDEQLYWMSRACSDRGKRNPGFPPGAANVVASLNYNLNDFAATIGSVQLRKLPSIVSRRQEVVKRLSEGLRDLATLTIPPQLPGAEPSWWFWRLEANTANLTCSKADYCATLKAEGLQVNPEYAAIPSDFEWFRTRRVFGTSGYPWRCPLYQGDPDQQFDLPNAHAAVKCQFNLAVHEGWSEQEIADAIAIFRKVDAALRRHA